MPPLVHVPYRGSYVADLLTGRSTPLGLVPS